MAGQCFRGVSVGIVDFDLRSVTGWSLPDTKYEDGYLSIREFFPAKNVTVCTKSALGMLPHQPDDHSSIALILFLRSHSPLPPHILLPTRLRSLPCPSHVREGCHGYC